MSFKKQTANKQKQQYLSKKEIYIKAVELWGVQAQMEMLVEECAETIVAVKKVFRTKSEHEQRMKELFLQEEIADVEIMCEQMRVIYGNDIIERIKKEKLERLKQLVGG